MKMMFSCVHFPIWPQNNEKPVFYTGKLYGLRGIYKYMYIPVNPHMYIYMGHSPENWTEEGAAFLMK